MDLGDGRLVVTAGHLHGSWFGYRSYDTRGVGPHEEVVVVHDEATGAIRATATGSELARRRVGAVGAVAVIGSGAQASTQLRALAAVRDLTEVRVYPPKSSHHRASTGLVAPFVTGSVHPIRDGQAACAGAHIIILRSPEPVVDAKWIDPGAYVTTLGPKQQSRSKPGLSQV